ncbi:MAG: MBOAT family O-acyltransferase [Chitinophagaceae bacterium]|nr:MBOAT family O-acyltransferase [Chitinophagaceae bacterium]
MAFIPAYILILFFTIVIDYYAGIMISGSEGKRRKMFLLLSIAANVLVLAVFKYYNFFIENVNVLLDTLELKRYDLPYLNIILPIGLSFHTFQAMSYTIEVYRKKFPPERHFGYYALYVMFYPQLVAGPIERPQNVLPQLHTYHQYDHSRMLSGLRLMLWGLFKKVVIADRIGMMADSVYNNLDQHTGFAYVVATVCFGIQIYCDFSGYSDIAIGSARTMGIDLMVNFKRPYFASTISEFWRRWHISLSTWFRDYVYIALGGNRVSNIKRNFNLFFVFLISGFWHGASWNFVIWGALHGFFLITGNFFQSRFPFLKQRNFVNILLTFLLANFAWIFFRATAFDDAMQVVRGLFSVHVNGNYFSLVNDDFKGNITYMGLPLWKFALTLLLIPMLFIADWFIEKGYVISFDRQPVVLRWSVYYILIIAILLLGVFETNQFIYFQF